MNFSKIKESIIAAGKYISGNTTIVTSKANLKLTLKSKNDELEKEYAKMGRKIFMKLTKKEKNKHKGIQRLEAEIKELNKELNIINETFICQNCGAKVTKNLNYCPDCGSKISD